MDTFLTLDIWVLREINGKVTLGMAVDRACLRTKPTEKEKGVKRGRGRA